MKITIITTCFNRATTISDCIQSVLSQDYPEIEYIIIDGASTDGSVAKIETIKKEYIESETFKASHPLFTFRFVSEPDHGMYEALNKGLQMATGDYVGLVHSDDFLYSAQTISHIVQELERTKADFLYGNGLFVNSENTNKVIRNWIGGNYRRWKVCHGWLPLHPTCYISRQSIQRKGLYNESYKIAADSDFLFRYLVTGELSVTYLNEYIVRMRMGGLSTDNDRRKEMWNEDIRMYRSHGMNPYLAKFEKILWKVPQFISALFL